MSGNSSLHSTTRGLSRLGTFAEKPEKPVPLHRKRWPRRNPGPLVPGTKSQETGFSSDAPFHAKLYPRQSPGTLQGLLAAESPARSPSNDLVAGKEPSALSALSASALQGRQPRQGRQRFTARLLPKPAYGAARGKLSGFWPIELSCFTVFLLTHPPPGLRDHVRNRDNGVDS